jgi:tellurite methyltransferase
MPQNQNKNNKNKDEVERDLWNRKYSEGSHTSMQPEPFLVNAFAEFLAATPPGLALDVAGGAGRNALWLAQRGWKVKLIDISEAGVALARENAARVLAPQPETTALFAAEVVDLNAPPNLGDGQYDLVIVFRYLQRELFPALIRALRPNGFLIYQTYTTAQEKCGGGPTNPSYLLQPGELLQAFSSMRVLHYEENTAGKALAELVAQSRTTADFSGPPPRILLRC